MRHNPEGYIVSIGLNRFAVVTRVKVRYARLIFLHSR
jgi:hypothetical protein